MKRRLMMLTVDFADLAEEVMGDKNDELDGIS